MEETNVNYLATVVSIAVAAFNIYWGVHLKSRMDRQNREIERKSAQLYSKRFSIIDEELWPATLKIQGTCGNFTGNDPASVLDLEAAISELKKIQLENLPFLSREIGSAVDDICETAAAEKFERNDYPALKSKVNNLVSILRQTME